MILIVLLRVSFDMVFSVLPAVSFEIILVVFFENGPNSFVSNSIVVKLVHVIILEVTVSLVMTIMKPMIIFFSQVTHEYSPSNSIV